LSKVEVVKPSRWTLARKRVSLDMAMMLWRRSWAACAGPVCRYVAFDASPQRGREIFATVERVVKLEDIAAWVNSPDGQLPPAEDRRLPLCTLGALRMGLAEKLQTHVQQVWLEYGPGLEEVRATTAAARQCLSDQGTELAIADAPDLLGECLGQIDGQARQRGPLYPKAICVPGPQHIIDGALQSALSTLPWWPAWNRQAKPVCQRLHAKDHREMLASFLPDTLDSVAKCGFVKALDTGIDKFAQWRWKTLSNVTKALERLRPAVLASTAGVANAKELSTKDSGESGCFLAAVRDDKF